MLYQIFKDVYNVLINIFMINLIFVIQVMVLAKHLQTLDAILEILLLLINNV